ncbi:MAG: tetratricopeptide repeat protein [Candidatus Coatesbacteria bacterium]|nr:tetratricopeptide repeat protein [Candidatus Coatesbacteria bacterium]
MLRNNKVSDWRIPVLMASFICLIALAGCGGGVSTEESARLCEMGRALGKEGKLQEAMVQFEKSIEADPKNALAHNGLGFCYLLLGQEDKAEPYLKKALELHPDLTKALLNLASMYHRQQKMKEAIPLWERLTEIDPNNATAWTHLSTAYMIDNQIEKALVTSKRAMELAPNDPEVLLNYASMQKALMKFDEAEKTYRKVVDMSPPQDQLRQLAMTGLLDIYTLQGEYPKAKVIGLMAREQFPSDYKIAYSLGLLHEKMGEKEEATKYHEEALRLAPDNPELLTSTANFFNRIGDRDRANSLYRKAIDADPAFIKAYIALISAGIEDGDDLDATESLAEKGLKAANEFERTRLLDQMSVIKRLKGELDAAIEFAKEAMAGVPENDKFGMAMTKVHLAEAYKAKKDFASTKAELEDALKLSPPEEILKEIELIAADLPPEWTPNLAIAEQEQSQDGSNK